MATKKLKSSGNTSVLKLSCCPAAHARAILEFTTGEKLALSPWWRTMPRLRIIKGTGDVRTYTTNTTSSSYDYRMSWRAANAPVFTLAHRGAEVDALKKRKRESAQVEACEQSKTVLFSHSTGECYVAKYCIHLSDGDPHVVVQYILEHQTPVHTRSSDSRCDDPTTAVNTTAITAAMAPLPPPFAFVSSLKVVDIVPCSDHLNKGRMPSAGERVVLMRNLESAWVKELYQQSIDNNGLSKLHASNFTDRRSVMWVGDANLNVVGDILNLQHTLPHKMECLVLLTDDPFLQIHIPVAAAAQQHRAALAVTTVAKAASSSLFSQFSLYHLQNM